MGSISKNMYARMVQNILDRKKITLFDARKKMVRQYEFSGFKVKFMWTDNAFESLREDHLVHLCC